MKNEDDSMNHAGSEDGLNHMDGKAMDEPEELAEQPAIPVDSRPDEGGEEAEQGRVQSQSQFQTSQDGSWIQAGMRPVEPEQWEQPESGGSRKVNQTSGDGQPCNGSQINGNGQPYNGNQSGAKGETRSISPQSCIPVPPYSSQNQGQSQYQPQNQYQIHQKPNKNHSMSIASMIMGILSLVTFCCSWLAIVVGILGIIFAIISKDGKHLDGQAKAGLILSIIGVSLGVIITILFIVLRISMLLPDIN